MKNETILGGFLKDHFFKILLGVVVLAVISLFRGDYSLTEYLRMRSRIEESRMEIEDLEERQADLEEEKSRLTNDGDYIEKIAREKYKMAKKGEQVIRVVRRSGE